MSPRILTFSALCAALSGCVVDGLSMEHGEFGISDDDKCALAGGFYDERTGDCILDDEIIPSKDIQNLST